MVSRPHSLYSDATGSRELLRDGESFFIEGMTDDRCSVLQEIDPTFIHIWVSTTGLGYQKKEVVREHYGRMWVYCIVNGGRHDHNPLYNMYEFSKIKKKIKY